MKGKAVTVYISFLHENLYENKRTNTVSENVCLLLYVYIVNVGVLLHLTGEGIR